MKIIKPLLLALVTFVVLAVGYEYYIFLWSRDQIGAIIRVDVIIVYPIILIICGFVFWLSKIFFKK